MKISQQIRDLRPYQPGKPIAEVQRELGLEKIYKLSSNENPLGPSPMVKKAIIDALDQISLYPDASCYDLNQAVSNYYKLDSQQISFGNGSEEIIDILIRLFCEPGDHILTSAHSFLIYKLSAQAVQVETIETPMHEDLKFDLKAMSLALKNNFNKIRLVFIANPNNPTGTYLAEDELKNFLDECSQYENTLVVIDEAYNEYVRAPDYPKTASWLNKYKNLIIIRTFSKVFGIAGLRLGVLLTHPEWVSYYQRIRKPFNVNALSQVAGVAVLKDKEYLRKTQEVNWQGLDFYSQEFDKMGLKYWPSQANFVLFKLPYSGDEAFQKMLKLGVIARPVTAYGLNNYLRLSVGLPEENQAAIDALKKIL
ncbi:MAG: histidinol-phosphate transaminase [Bdellovibrionaceae bacterium]|nr:histidinol-phosphate transaminase [Pseudobdellovibrionaceae bacterium]